MRHKKAAVETAADFRSNDSIKDRYKAIKKFYEI